MPDRPARPARVPRDRPRGIALDEALDLGALVVHDAVDAEVEVGAVELEEFMQEFLKFL